MPCDRFFAPRQQWRTQWAATTQQHAQLCVGTAHCRSPVPGSSSSSGGGGLQPPTSSRSSQPPPLQVTRSNFAAALPALQAALSGCQFFAFDCEMSGLFLAGQEDYAADDVDDRYVKTAAAAEAFLVTQFGLSVFTWTGGGYEATSFNFHLFPAPTDDTDLRFTCQASSLAFLASQGFDFNKMIYEGVPFLPLSWRDKQLQAASDASRAAAAPPALDALDEDEAALAAQLAADIAAWLDSSGPAAGDTLYLPAPPPQLLKLQRQLLAAGIGSSRWKNSNSSSGKSKQSTSNSSSSGSGERLYLVEQCAPSGPLSIAASASPPAASPPSGSSSSGSSAGFLLRRATAAELAAAAEAARQQRSQQVNAASGFSLVFELLRDSGKPAVGHNLRFDLCFALASFVQSPLPRSWSEYKALVGRWFPGGVFDTKHLARSLPGSSGSGHLLHDTALGGLYSLVAQADPAQPQPLAAAASSSTASPSAAAAAANLAAWLGERLSHVEAPGVWTTLPAVRHTPGCEAYASAAAAAAAAAGGGAAHEAGFDAFMTGVVFVALLRLYEVDGLAQRSRWLLPQAPAAPPDLGCVAALGWRQHNARSPDIPYAALQGPELVPQRPNVLYVTGFSSNTRWFDIQRRFVQLGLGKPPVSMVRGNGLAAAPTGAYVIMPGAKQAQRALQAVREAGWGKLQVMSYSDFFFSKHAGQEGGGSSDGGGSGGSGGAGSAGSRPAPVAMQLQAGSDGDAAAADGSDNSGSGSSRGAAVAVQEMQQLTQELQRKSAAVQQRRKQQQAAAAAERAAAAAKAQAVACPEAGGTTAAVSSPNGGDGSSSSSSSSDSEAEGGRAGEAADGNGSGSTTEPSPQQQQQQQGALVAAQQRLALLNKQAASAQAPSLKRPAVALKRPPPPPSW